MGYQVDPQTGYQVWVDDQSVAAAKPQAGKATPSVAPLSSQVPKYAQAEAQRQAAEAAQRQAAARQQSIQSQQTGYYDPRIGAAPKQVSGAPTPPQMAGIDRNGISSAAFPNQANANGPMQDPGNNLTNPGYGEQAFLYSQNRLLEDPSAGMLQDQYNNLQNPSQGEAYMNQNLGSLDGPGMGEQYWNQVQGQYMSPFEGEQFAREQAQQFGPQGPASAFYNQAMGDYDSFVNYQGAGNTQGQYNQSSQSLAGGTKGEQGLGQLAGQYDQIGQYQGGNQASSQYQQNAASGPLAGQQFYDQVAGSFGTKGTYSDPNLAAGQYAQTQGAFGDMPIANFDPFYDRAIQLGTQDYNRQSAGRGVYGSSEALSGVGNIITDLNAQRANRSFDAEMQRAQEQRMRQQLLGEQARMGDLSSLAAFGANLSGVETYGNLANNAGNQTLGQQTMLGNQARQADQTALDAFNGNINAATAFGNINNQLASQELNRNELLGNMANNADSQATSAQNSRVSGLNAMAGAASNADTAELNRFNSRNDAMLTADRQQLDRMNAGADIAFRGDDSKRADYTQSMTAAQQAANLGMDRNRQGADIASQMSTQDLARLNSFNSTAQGAEAQRQSRQIAKLESTRNLSSDMQNMLSNALANFDEGNSGDFENYFQATLAPALQAAGLEQQDIDRIRADLGSAYKAAKPTPEP